MQWDVDISKKRRERPLEVERLMSDLLSRLDEDEPVEEETEHEVMEEGKALYAGFPVADVRHQL